MEKRLSKWDDAWKECELEIVGIKVTREKSTETKVKFLGHYLKQVEFVHLWSDDKEGRIQNEINRRIQSGAKCYHLIISLLWIKTYHWIVKKNVKTYFKPILIYGAGTWTMTRKIQVESQEKRWSF